MDDRPQHGCYLLAMRMLALALLIAAGPALAEEVSLELVLLADASGSITEEEIAFQRQGYAEAITHPEVLSAIGGTLTGSITITYVEWAANQAVVADWSLISDETSARTFADAILAPPRQAVGRNAIGAALLAGAAMIESNSFEGYRRVIDFSGDSTGNFSGPGIEEARDLVVAQGITINALPIVCENCARPQAGDLTEEYRARIIGGQGAFVEPAHGRADFAAAVRRKLVLEIAGALPDLRQAKAEVPD